MPTPLHQQFQEELALLEGSRFTIASSRATSACNSAVCGSNSARPAAIRARAASGGAGDAGSVARSTSGEANHASAPRGGLAVTASACVVCTICISLLLLAGLTDRFLVNGEDTLGRQELAEEVTPEVGQGIPDSASPDKRVPELFGSAATDDPRGEPPACGQVGFLQSENGQLKTQLKQLQAPLAAPPASTADEPASAEPAAAGRAPTPMAAVPLAMAGRPLGLLG